MLNPVTDVLARKKKNGDAQACRGEGYVVAEAEIAAMQLQAVEHRDGRGPQEASRGNSFFPGAFRASVAPPILCLQISGLHNCDRITVVRSHPVCETLLWQP